MIVSRHTRPLIKLPTERHPLCPHLARRGISEGTCSRVGRTEASAIRSQVTETSRSTKSDRPPEVFTILNSTYEHVFMVEIRRFGWEPVTFFEEEEKGIIFPHSDPMIIRADIADFDLGRILIDTGSSVNVRFADAFNGLGIDHQSLNKEITLLLSFSGDVVEPIGSI
ncbi:unnamed protein product [Prunus armeniaca]